jgi:DNA primase
MSTAKPTLAPSRLENVREYYRLITDINIGQIARELLTTRVTYESPDLLQCNCPHHSSTSKTSLHIILDKQAFYCFGCGVGGDVLQLVEFLQSGQVTRGRSGQITESHRAARDFLAQRAGLPPLASYGLSTEEIKSLEARQSQNIRVQEILGALASYYNEKLLKNPEVLAWFEKKYQISRDTIARLQIGYAENTDPITHITSLPIEKPFDFGELASTGTFTPTSQDGIVPFFDHRIVFPYWSRGRVVFMIGRQTPWTPDKPWEQGKYKKLPVHDEKKCAHIAPCINNSVLFNEDVLLTNPESVIITEGVTDCISLMERGFPAISPVTVRIKDDDWDHLLPKLNGIRTVYVCQDNEISEAGLQGALKTARILSERKIETRIAVLPLNEKQIVARARLSSEFNVTAAIGTRELSKQLAAAAKSAADQNTAQSLLADSKIDVNEYFASGHTDRKSVV